MGVYTALFLKSEYFNIGWLLSLFLCAIIVLATNLGWQKGKVTNMTYGVITKFFIIIEEDGRWISKPILEISRSL